MGLIQIKLILNRKVVTKRSVFITLFFLIFSIEINGQDKAICISGSAVHVNQDSDQWFNASAFDVGFQRDLIENVGINIEFSHIVYFRGDKSGGDVSTNALLRSFLTMRVLKSEINLTLLKKNNWKLSIYTGPSIRYLSEINHIKAEFTGEENNTNEILTTTKYNRSKDIGVVFGLSYELLFNNKIRLQIFNEAINFGGSSNSVIKSGLGIGINL